MTLRVARGDSADALTGKLGAPGIRMASLVLFKPGTARGIQGKDREKLMALAASWRKHGAVGDDRRWDGYATGSRSPALAQRRADKIRGYLIRYGVTPDYVLAVGHDPRLGDGDHRTSPARVDLAIAFCSRASGECRVKDTSRVADLRRASRRETLSTAASGRWR